MKLIEMQIEKIACSIRELTCRQETGKLLDSLDNIYQDFKIQWFGQTDKSKYPYFEELTKDQIAFISSNQIGIFKKNVALIR